jgi:Putative 2OG-Fe(II) oxygenase
MQSPVLVRPLWPTFLWSAKSEDAAFASRLSSKALEINREMINEEPKTFFDRHKENIFSKYAKDDDVRRVGRMFVRAARNYVQTCYGDDRSFRVDIVGWVSVQEDGDATPWHSHLGTAHLSAIYYTDVAEGGDLLLEDPRPISRDWDLHGNKLQERHYAHVRPEPGLLIIFPGFVRHATTRFLGHRRVCWVADMTINYDGIEERPVSESVL